MSNFICEHAGVCHAYCFVKQNKSCQLLTKAIEKIYEVDVMRTERETPPPTVQPVPLADTKRPSVTRVSRKLNKL